MRTTGWQEIHEAVYAMNERFGDRKWKWDECSRAYPAMRAAWHTWRDCGDGGGRFEVQFSMKIQDER